jgi:hypothetical protein
VTWLVYRNPLAQPLPGAGDPRTSPPLCFRKGKWGQTYYAHRLGLPTDARKVSQVDVKPVDLLLPFFVETVVVCETEPKVLE